METTNHANGQWRDVLTASFATVVSGRQRGECGGEASTDWFLIALTKCAKRNPLYLTQPFRSNKPRDSEKFNKLMAVTDLVLGYQGNQWWTTQNCYQPTNKTSWFVQISIRYWEAQPCVTPVYRDGLLIELGTNKPSKNVDKHPSHYGRIQAAN